MIRCYTGKLGQGKTYEMVRDSVFYFRRHKPQIFTNMAALKCPEAIYFDHIEELCDLSHGLVLLDEAAIIIPAQFWSELGRDLLTRFNQLRKHGLDLFYTAQRHDGVNNNLREITDEMYLMRKIGGRLFRYNVDTDSKTVARMMCIPRAYNASIFSLYDSWETISEDGSSTGRAQWTALSRVARKALAEHDAERSAHLQAKKRPLTFRPVGSNGLRLTRKAQAALDFLRSEGVYRGDDQPDLRAVDMEDAADALPAAEQEWAAQLRAELDRREWLALWGLGVDDVPLDCSPSAPWLSGYDPATVKLRRAESLAGRTFRAAEEAAHTLELKKLLQKEAAVKLKAVMR